MSAFQAPRAPDSLRRQALLAQQQSAAAHNSGSSPLAALGEEQEVHAVLQDCSLDSSSEPSSKRSIALHSWEDYWDSRQQVDVPGRGAFTVYSAGTSGAVVFCLHGGGYTSLTWSLVARQLKDRYRVVALDLRGHGSTTTSDDVAFSRETMSQDVVAVWQALFGGCPARTLLVGHSMGGALAVWAAASKQIAGLDGVVVIDVVEGTALAALPHMMAVLSSRPAMFQTLQVACDWALRSGMCKCREAAGVSLPSQLVQASPPDGVWTWRTPLAASQPYWQGWYSGLSDAFLALTVPKMLLLAGTDRLDKVLTIGQMQGKFQLVLMPAAGHAIQEDEPVKTAQHLQQFLHRFRIGEPPMVIPRAAPGVTRVLPVVGGPLHEPAAAQPAPH